MKNNITIAHISDCHLRFSNRHEEYREVFQRLYEDLRKTKPNYIFFTGDLFHQKISLSPTSISLATEFIVELSKIAPVLMCLGNHDLNMQQKEQNDMITPIIDIANKFYDLSKTLTKKEDRRAFIVADNESGIDFSRKGVYFFPNSGIYNISDKLAIGVYSCKDGKIFTLDKKEPGVKYVAMCHDSIKGARLDNGYEAIGEGLIDISTFSNYDSVFLGHIHCYQSFRNEEVAYSGALIQQQYGDDINCGYLMWDLGDENKPTTHQRRYILNDYGFAKITIAKGEIIEDRIENIQFSNDKRKTKVYVVWSDFEENYSTEKESQIARLIKEKYGCEVVKVEFSEIKKAQQDNTDVADSRNKETFLQQITNYLKETNPDEDEETINEVLDLAEFIDKELEISDRVEDVKYWDVDKVEISNVFSFSEKPIIINLEELSGSTGIFGKNYSGKSNIVKAIVWGLYEYILGGASAKKVVNIYTTSNKGYVKINLTIDGEKYYIKKEVVTKVDKKGESSNSYSTEYKKLVVDENGKEVWSSEISDRKATEKKEVKNIILNAIGTVDDFTKVCLQTQGGKEDYINQAQQPKNDLVNKYLGLEPYRDRYDFGNKKLNDIKKRQKELGNISSIQGEMLLIENKITEFQKEYDLFVKEKLLAEVQKDKVDDSIISLTKSLKKAPQLLNDDFRKKEDVVSYSENTKEMIEKNKIIYNDLISWTSINLKKELPFDENEIIGILGEELSIVENASFNISKIQQQLLTDNQKYGELFNWCSTNFKKELPFNGNESAEQLNRELIKEGAEFDREKKEYIQIENWIKINPTRQLYKIDGYDSIIAGLNIEISQLNSTLPTYKGEKCPTCGHITMEPNPEMYNQCLQNISEKTGTLNNYINLVNKFHEDSTHNNNCEIQKSNLQTLKANLTNRKNKKEALVQKIGLISQSQVIISHNKDVDLKNQQLQNIKNEIENKNKNIERIKLLQQSQEILVHNKIVNDKNSLANSTKSFIEEKTKLLEKLSNNLLKIIEIEECETHNSSINDEISQFQEQSKGYKFSIYGLSQQINNKNGDIRVEKNNLENYTSKLEEVKSAEKTYKKYSLYLQAVYRDGIPARIIRRKLPIINNKINSILSTIVSFKIEMSVNVKGDIIEEFYYGDNKSYSLPLASASGAQKFISSVVIKDALHYMSNLIKPSLNIIDEGFGTLDDDLISGIITVLQYLKNKYKNVLVITHRNEIKDSVNNIIEVYSTKEGIPKEVLAVNKDAGITKINIS